MEGGINHPKAKSSHSFLECKDVIPVDGDRPPYRLGVDF